MGMWDQTCVISQLPILSGQDVYALALYRDITDVSTGSGVGTSYASDIWRPNGLLIAGEYDAYGCSDPVAYDVGEALLLKLLPEHMPVEPNGAIESIDAYVRYSKDPERFAWGFCLMLKSVADAVATTATRESLAGLEHDLGFPENNHVLSRALAWNEATWYLMDCLPELESPQFRERLVLTARVHAAMEDLRKGWFPQYGQGGQQHETAPYRVLLQAMEAQLDLIDAEDAEIFLDIEEDA